ncbi:HAD-superfamily hydrolase, partial [Thamnocephalis sphaerospora]
YDPLFAVRGLHYDGHTGYLMKLDAYGNVQRDTVHYGRREVEVPLAVPGVDSGDHIPRGVVKGRMRQLLDLFSIPNACLLADVIQYFVDRGISFHPQHLADDVRLVSEMLHGGTGIGMGPLHRTILRDLEQYLEPNPQLTEYLERLSAHDRRLFLLTNSGFEFVDRGLSYITGRADWRDLFDVCIVNAAKPEFYRGRRPFQRYEEGYTWSTVGGFKRGEVYSGGNITDFCNWTGWTGGSVIYIGDSIYSDLGAIISELSREIEIQRSYAFRSNIASFVQLEQLLKCTQRSHLEHHREQLLQWRKERKETSHVLKKLFNPQFGSVFRTMVNPTMFADKIRAYADLYTASLENLGGYPIDHVFYPERIQLPHEQPFFAEQACGANDGGV